MRRQSGNSDDGKNRLSPWSLPTCSVCKFSHRLQEPAIFWYGFGLGDRRLTKNCRKTLSAQIGPSPTKCAPGRGALYRDNLPRAGGATFTVRFRVDGGVPPNHAPINMRRRQACSDRARLLSPIAWFGVSLWRAGLYANLVRPGGQRRNSIESARTGQEVGPTGTVTDDCCAHWSAVYRPVE